MELLLSGDEETVGWKADTSEYLVEEEEDVMGASSQGDGAQELSALMRRGKHLSPKETARASELIKAGLLVKAASSSNIIDTADSKVDGKVEEDENKEEDDLPIVFKSISLDDVFEFATPRLEIFSSSCASVLLKLLPLVPIAMQSTALSDLLRLLSCKPKNVVTVAQSTAWQSALFNLVAPHVVAVENESRDRIVNLLSLQTNEKESALGLASQSWQEAQENRGDACYEYQRWLPIRGWSMSLLPTDPGKWSDENQTKFGSALSEVAPVLPSGWEVEEAWLPQEWETSILSSFRSTQWSLGVLTGRTVRRRKWARSIRLRESPNIQPTVLTAIEESVSSTDAPICGLARRLLVKVLACCMSLPEAVSPLGTDVELIMVTLSLLHMF